MNRLAISFSGGRSSAVMSHLCYEKYKNTHDIVATFANTGCEHEETLRFVSSCDRHIFDNQLVWIEAVFHEHGKGPTAKVVDYETASRDGSPFWASIKKHGVFCRTHPQCTSRLKEEPMISYRRSIGWESGSYDVAIGIRADEADRISPNRKKKRFIYPLVNEGWGKRDVNRFMSQFDWDLNLPSDAFGNCVWCWKKSRRKLLTVAKADPSVFDFPGEMERRHGAEKPDENGNPRVFFRNYQSAQDLLRDSILEDFQPYEDEKFDDPRLFDDWWDTGQGCGDSCEIE